ncbi:hypothetical protein OPT61_g6802 [Boeremia exigua]|uniref:Uncharacterized protein n=1 Tax=Boeremia exigua TaxID=749465 RepID=A0ACC2I581_9PLEO|nr:hypothetical protein OPT61_g6802 [Boeremia exigua]
MSFESLPDHYKALGIDKSADAATIKKTYRKLVLTCHPDKVTDEALKAQKQDEFHKIQQAYETLSDETRKSEYEAQLKLQQLRREKLARAASGTSADPKSAHFTQPTSGSYTANTSSRYQTEERRPTGTTSSRHYEYEDERFHGAHKTDSHYTSSRRSSPRPTPSSRSSRDRYEKETRREKPDRTRSSTAKARDSDRRDRTGRFPVDSEGSSGEDRARQERERERERERVYKTRTVEDDSQRREERRRDDRRDDHENTSPRKEKAQQEDAIRYIYKSRAEAERPSPIRTTSRDYYEPSSRSSRHREVRPEPAPRRSLPAFSFITGRNPHTSPPAFGD